MENNTRLLPYEFIMGAEGISWEIPPNKLSHLQIQFKV